MFAVCPLLLPSVITAPHLRRWLAGPESSLYCSFWRSELRWLVVQEYDQRHSCDAAHDRDRQRITLYLFDSSTDDVSNPSSSSHPCFGSSLEYCWTGASMGSSCDVSGWVDLMSANIYFAPPFCGDGTFVNNKPLSTTSLFWRWRRHPSSGSTSQRTMNNSMWFW